MKGRYSKSSKLDFGMYKGYELGIVYLFDPSYVEWCINNIENFCVPDLEELMEYSVQNENLDWHYRMVGDPSLIPNIDFFDAFEEVVENVNLGDKKYFFAEETITLTNSRNSDFIEKTRPLRPERGSFISPDDLYDGMWDRGGYSDWDEGTWGQQTGLCDMADNCGGAVC